MSKSGTYKVWNLETRKVDVSKDVTFCETQFPSRRDFEQANTPEANAPRTNVSDNVNAPMANVPTPQIFREIVVEKPPPGAHMYTAKEPQKRGQIYEPSTYEEAISCAEAEHWRKAMNDEINCIMKNKT